jgi:hypothetical protein
MPLLVARGGLHSLLRRCVRRRWGAASAPACGAAAAAAAAAAASAAVTAAGTCERTPFCSLEGKVAVVTGVTPGSMGESIAMQLASQGCSIVAADIPLPERTAALHRSVASLAKVAPRVLAVPTDVPDLPSVERLFAVATREMGRVDIAVATVGGGGFSGDGKLCYANKMLAHEEPWGVTMRTLATTQFSAHHTGECVRCVCGRNVRRLFFTR